MESAMASKSEKIRGSKLRHWADPAYRERMLVMLAKARKAHQESGAPLGGNFAGHRHTEESKRRQSEKMRAIRAERKWSNTVGRTLSPATRAKIAVAHLGMKHTPEARAKISAAKKGRVVHTPEWRAAISKLFRGRPAQYPNRRIHYGGAAFRSSWEVRAAKALDALGVRWEYESRRFDLGSQTYAPDFYLPDDSAYWEVKGYFGPKSQRTIRLFREQYPDVPLVLLTERGLALLEKAASGRAAA